MSDLEDRIIACDGGRFAELAKALDVKDVCLGCKTFNYNSRGHYKCAITGSCIGVTLGAETNAYILWKIGEQTEAEFMAFLGI